MISANAGITVDGLVEAFDLQLETFELESFAEKFVKENLGKAVRLKDFLESYIEAA